VSAWWAATPESPRAAIATGSTPSGRVTTSSRATAATSLMLPSPGAIPAEVANHTGRPARVPTPWTPGTYGVPGTPKYDVPEAHSRSSGTIGAAATSTRTPSPGTGVVRSTTSGG
jgi:hypothetical protein